MNQPKRSWHYTNSKMCRRRVSFKTTSRLVLMALTVMTLHTILAQEEIINSTTSECEPLMVPMCRGLVGYNFTHLPNRFNHTTQEEVYWALQPWWPFMDMGCSDNLRIFLCALYLPRCTPGIPTLTTDLPCSKTCKKAQSRCAATVEHHGLVWGEEMDCERFEKSHTCVKPKREMNKQRRRQIITCRSNPLPMCQHMPHTLGSLPNPFMQNDLNEIAREMEQYRAMMESGCSTRLSFLLCGAFMPFCVENPERPYLLPCREVCEQVQHDCRREFHHAWGGLPWPAKLQCHRYPSHDSPLLQEDSTTVPCAMPPAGF